MMDDILTPMEKMDNAIKRANARAEAAEAEVERLRAALEAMRAVYYAGAGRFGGTGISDELQSILDNA